MNNAVVKEVLAIAVYRFTGGLGEDQNLKLELDIASTTTSNTIYCFWCAPAFLYENAKHIQRNGFFYIIR